MSPRTPLYPLEPCAPLVHEGLTLPEPSRLSEETFREWLCSMARQQGLPRATLLATADDGVCWGSWEDTRLELATEALTPWLKRLDPDAVPGNRPLVGALLRPQTLQHLRLFAPEGELRVWRSSRRNAQDQLSLTLLATWVAEGRDAPKPEHLWKRQTLRYGLIGAELGKQTRTVLKEGPGTFTLLRGLAGALQAVPGCWDGARGPALSTAVYYAPSPEGQLLVQETRWLCLESLEGESA